MLIIWKLPKNITGRTNALAGHMRPAQARNQVLRFGGEQ